MALIGFTRKADYGLTMLAELARVGKGGVVSTKKLASGKGLPRAFLAQIGKELVAAGVIGSKEGKKGGYYLKEDPVKVKIKEALEVIDGRVSPVLCTTHPGKCPLEHACSHKGMMGEIAGKVETLLEQYSLADLVS